MNYTEAIEYIQNTSKYGNNTGTKRVEKILDILGNPHKDLKCIHIAGTNGKGSITSMITSILIESGYRVGMYTSPYIEDFEERIQINRENISKDDLAYYTTIVSEAIEKVVSMGWGYPTEFETITCIMFLYYSKKQIDYAVIEVGLGGKSDSTNVIKPLVSIITSISYDHVSILGNTIEEIASEKAGIIKENVPVILYPQQQGAYKVIEKTCKEKGSKLIQIDENLIYHIPNEDFNKSYQLLQIKTNKDEYKVQLSLLGSHQRMNCAVAIYTIEELMDRGIKITKEDILRGLSNVKWPGRLEMLKSNPLVVLDGAHNLDGITKLKESVEHYFRYKKLVLIIGILSDKDVEKMIEIITPMADKIIAVTPNSYRGKTAQELIKIIEKHNKNCEALDEYKEAYIKALDYCDNEDMILICGSLYMIGDMRKIIRNI
ncbi:bifunctional folylpolyglutamate synthase/dihydrofolate synthase [Clostridium cochlearium]|uniref:tetrahydrofolate synthase n=1 Tax=Clostridium cochlearium TaxID=1494 RepID=A0A240ATM5_CLOCO|nr:folylpolyglutamate synthase/dihydrofolate synthase family protein [Clostridium cochlearium]MBV1819427.1 bifunctional folylpolyglutamate synthase/dihydrofolate synthase [Bacteroidales bacterium MSK.15.36]NSJ91497.1 bifunctional folylpolyglutamate synthase/dihydrofolate synthase [Coprococcus sp. MSK.21.13]MBE6064796.1 bifunctional folylpolyglutamate synthase/dihydrofolate synthase [Clostridium cochlearium]MBU5268258.1 bifunctional folylpolyglutamate synthase/dihydrofolate synthase [Clostridium